MSGAARATYEIILPDGNVRTRNSARIYTHAVVAQGERGWGLVAFCGSLALAEKRIEDWRRCVPSEPAQIVTARAITPLTDRQRQALIELGDKTVEMFGASHLAPLVKRGLVERSYIGMRHWRVRRTEAGRKAVEGSS